MTLLSLNREMTRAALEAIAADTLMDLPDVLASIESAERQAREAALREKLMGDCRFVPARERFRASVAAKMKARSF